MKNLMIMKNPMKTLMKTNGDGENQYGYSDKDPDEDTDENSEEGLK